MYAGPAARAAAEDFGHGEDLGVLESRAMAPLLDTRHAEKTTATAWLARVSSL